MRKFYCMILLKLFCKLISIKELCDYSIKSFEYMRQSYKGSWNIRTNNERLNFKNFDC